MLLRTRLQALEAAHPLQALDQMFACAEVLQTWVLNAALGCGGATSLFCVWPDALPHLASHRHLAAKSFAHCFDVLGEEARPLVLWAPGKMVGVLILPLVVRAVGKNVCGGLVATFADF